MKEVVVYFTNGNRATFEMDKVQFVDVITPKMLEELQVTDGYSLVRSDTISFVKVREKKEEV